MIFFENIMESALNFDKIITLHTFITMKMIPVMKGSITVVLSIVITLKKSEQPTPAINPLYEFNKTNNKCL